MYTRENIFVVKWERNLKYRSLALPGVSLEFRIYFRKGYYEVWQRYRSETPWKLGVYHSLQEATWYVYDYLLYFHVYETGTWNPQQHPRVDTPGTRKGR